uniref:Uncharacterized protein n=1 Tax=Arundo donax TaxID=35708 RepID=A0A0A9C9U6_ARUDO
MEPRRRHRCTSGVLPVGRHHSSIAAFYHQGIAQ